MYWQLFKQQWTQRHFYEFVFLWFLISGICWTTLTATWFGPLIFFGQLPFLYPWVQKQDAQILARIEEIQAVAQPFFQKESLTILLPTWSAVGIVTVKDEGQIRSLIYCLCDRIRIQPPPESWPFSAQGEHWLSDELELVTSQLGAALPGTFLHRILLSSGIVMEIPFTSVIVHEFSLVGIPQEV